MTPLNVIYIGQQPFPYGPATSKRRRYMVDYMNAHNIKNHVLITFHPNTPYKNPSEGYYNNTDYISIKSDFGITTLNKYYSKGKAKLAEWYDNNSSNILIFPTVMNFMDYPFYSFAKKMGYKIVFDQVETSYLKSNKLSWKSYIYFWLNEKVSKKAYSSSSSFVISSRLMQDNKKSFPNMKLCLLPNSTPLFTECGKSKLNNPIRIFYSGTYGKKEGVEYLIEGVIKAIKKGIPCNVTLTGKAPTELIDKYKNTPYTQKIVFKGFVSDEELKKLLIESDVLAMVRTNTEFANYGFPFKLSEYLATGNIVMATKVGDIEEYMADGENAYLIEPENSDEICKTIVQIYNNQQQACEIASKGLHTAQTRFSIETIGNIFENFLKSL